jgi:23S rRNA (uracil1939-C5)-methyltransferase
MANYFKAKPKKVITQSPIRLTIERLDNNGQGVGFYDKKPTFVQGALPAEQVKVQIIEQKSKFNKAKLLEVVKASEYRQQPRCIHFQQCGGCDLQHLTVSAQLIFKQQKLTELFNRQNLEQTLPWQEPITAPAWHYRRKARIGVQYNKNGQAIIGFRRAASNQLHAIKNCPVLVEQLADIFTQLNKVFSELSQSQPIGHIEVLVTQHQQNQANLSQVTLVIRQLKPINKDDKQCWQKLAQQHSWQILLDDGEQVIPLVEYQALQFTVPENINIQFNSNDFIQVNDAINQQMINQAICWLNLDADDKILDLFCGLGNFTLPIAKQVKHIVGIEGVVSMVERAQQNARANNISNADFYQADLNKPWLEQLWAQQPFSKVILDPARAGALGAINQVIKLKIPTILYVSCDPATLALDSKTLITSGYTITKIALMDMFTHTKHSETMVLFSR